MPSRSTTCDENMIVRMPTTTSTSVTNRPKLSADDDAEADRVAVPEQRRRRPPRRPGRRCPSAADRHPLVRLAERLGAPCAASAASVTQSIGTIGVELEWHRIIVRPRTRGDAFGPCVVRRSLALGLRSRSTRSGCTCLHALDDARDGRLHRLQEDRREDAHHDRDRARAARRAPTRAAADPAASRSSSLVTSP